MSHSSLNRRDLLKGLCVIPAVAALDGCCKLCSAPAQETLNVVLHGAYVLELNQDAGKAFVRIPKVDSHVYKIGHWLNEDTLEATEQGKPLRIENLVGSTALPSMPNLDNNDAVVRKALTPATSPLIVIEMPIPKTVVLARNAYLQDDNGQHLNFFADTNLLNQPQQVAMTLVLTYGVDVKSQLPRIYGHNWPPSINLHIFAEPCVDPDGSHMLDAFHAVRALYKELSSLELDKDWCPPNSATGCKVEYEQAIRATPPAGLSAEEILSLAEREQMVPHCTKKTSPVGAGGHHVGTCLHLIMIS